MFKRFARYLGKMPTGERVHRIPVRVHLNSSRYPATTEVHEFTVLARNAADAANYVRDSLSTRVETEVFAWGPKGGEVHRYVGWDSAVWAQMSENRTAPIQLDMLARSGCLTA